MDSQPRVWVAQPHGDERSRRIFRATQGGISSRSPVAEETPAMRLPRVRFTVRRLMVAVAVVALILAVAEQLQRRRESFQQQAEVYRRKTGDAYMAAQITRSGNLFVWDPRTSPAHEALAD